MTETLRETPGARRGLTLRRFLLLLVAAGVAYVGLIALVIAVRIAPTARSLRQHSTQVLTAHDAIRTRLGVLGQSINGVHHLVLAGRATGVRPSPDSVRALILPIRARLDSIAAQHYAETLEGIPAEMRLELARATQAEGDLGIALLDALANLQLGRHDSALARLRTADEYRARTEDLLQSAQRLALADMVERERRLGDVTTMTSRAVFWWLAIGAGMLPLLAWFVRRRLYHPLAELEAALTRIADGHLDVRIQPARDDEIGRLGRHLNAMTAVLRLRADDERRRRENLSERLGYLLEDSDNQILVFADDTLRISQASRGALEHLGYVMGGLQDCAFTDLLPPADGAAFPRLLEELRTRRQTEVVIETRLRRGDGRSYPATVNVQLSRTEQPPVFVAVAQDVSERREVERLRDAQREFSVSRGALLAAGDLERVLHEITTTTAEVLHAERVSVWRLDGGCIRCADLYERSRSRHGGGQEVTAAACERYVTALRQERVIAIDDIRARDATSMFPILDGKLVIGASLDALVQSSGLLAGALRVEHVGQPRHWTPEEQSFVASMADFVAIAIEGAERRSLQAQLGESQRLESVGQLAGGVAHDFNNLLTAMMSHAELAAIDLPDEHPAIADLQGILHAAQRAAELTKQLLTFARRHVVEPKVVDLNSLTRKMDKLLRRLIGENVELVTLQDPDLGATCIDPTQFEQVVVNLAVNARDAMPSGGTLTIQTSNVALTRDYARQHAECVPGRYVMLSVSDTGVGMDDAIRTRVFEPFFTTKDRSRGTGLGLATVYGIVRQAGGTITVHSTPGLGTTFRVYFPLVEDAVSADVVRAAVAAPRGNETILLVEDEAQIRRVLARGLAAQGYHVVLAGNGAEGLEAARQHTGPIHLLVTDVVMPLLNGRDLATRLATERPETAVLFMSGYAEEAIVHQGVIEPGIAFLSKPFTVVELGTRVREALDRARDSGQATRPRHESVDRGRSEEHALVAV